MKTSLRILLGLSRVAAVLALATTAGGCVAAKHYDEARSVAETEMAGHARTRARLEKALARLDGLEKELRDKALLLAEKEQELDVGQSAVAASKLETTVAMTEKRAAGELVDQLRAELARTGDHLRAYAGEKQSVEQALVAAEQRLRTLDAASKSMNELVAVARDVAIGLGGKLVAGEASLAVRDGTLVLGVPLDELFVPEQSALGPNTGDVLATVASVAVAHPSYRVELRGPRDTMGELRTQTLHHALIDKGAPTERVVLTPSSEQAEPAPVADAAAAPSGDEAPARVDGRGDGPAASSAPLPVAAPVAPYEIVFSRL